MNETNVLFDRLAGTLMLYVENFFLNQATYNDDMKIKVQPSYKVDYEISEDIILGLKESALSNNIDNIWYHKISGCKNINDLPEYLIKLIVQFLPRFFEQYPQYTNEECLKVNHL